MGNQGLFYVFILKLASLKINLLRQAQIVLLGILVVAQIDFVIGSIIGPMDDTEIAKGFVGYNGNQCFLPHSMKIY
jgi:solute carrier family 12 (sodium/potassium/chloride transporter), member 2